MEPIFFLFAIAAFVSYFVPTVIAYKRQTSVALVLLVNIFVGWTGIGWIAALALACFSPSAVGRMDGTTYPPPSSPGQWRQNGPPPPLPPSAAYSSQQPTFERGATQHRSYTSRMEGRFANRIEKKTTRSDDHM